jgi:repressor LexA
MIECGIFEGDIVILRRQTYADDGDIVAARVEDQATLKRLMRKNNKIYLMPENRNYKPIIVDKVAILGKVTAIYRKY